MQRNAEVHVVPWNYDYTREEYDGLFISNGPGDPSYAKSAVETLRKVSCHAFGFSTDYVLVYFVKFLYILN